MHLGKLSISKYFTIFVISISVLTFFLYSYFRWNIYSKNIKSDLESQSLRISESFVDTIDYTAYLMNYINSQIRDNDSLNVRYISSLLSSFRLNSEVNNRIPWNMFSWTNNKLKLTVNSDRGIVKPIDVSDRDYISLTISDPNKIHIGKPVYGKVSKTWIIPSGMGIADYNGNYLGATIFGFNIKKLTEKLELSLNITGVSFAIYDIKNKEIVISSKDFLLDESYNNFITHYNFSKPSGEITKYSLFSDNKFYGFYQNVEKYPYVIITKYNNSFFQRKLSSELYPRIFEIIAIFTILFTSFYALRLVIISPILKLSQAANAISKDRDSEVKSLLPKTKIYEINTLASQLLAIQEYKINLLQAKKSQNNFFANMSHELRTPLTGAMSYAELMKNEIHGPLSEDYKKLSDIIFKSGRHLLSLIDELLNFSRLNADKTALYDERLDIGQEVQEAIDIVAADAKKDDITIDAKFFHNKYMLKADKSMFKRMLLNLLSNAIKFSHHGGKVSVVTQVNGSGELSVAVIDQGVGIKEENIPQILEEYGQVKDSHINDKRQGVGLGLPITQKMVALHQAKFKIESTLEKGTTATINFPRARLLEPI